MTTYLAEVYSAIFAEELPQSAVVSKPFGQSINKHSPGLEVWTRLHPVIGKVHPQVAWTDHLVGHFLLGQESALLSFKLDKPVSLAQPSQWTAHNKTPQDIAMGTKQLQEVVTGVRVGKIADKQE